MARRRRTLTQYAVRILTPGVPRFAKNILASRACAPMVLLALIGLFATGIMSLKWGGFLPSLFFNQERATEVAEQVSDAKGVAEVGKLASKVRDELPESMQVSGLSPQQVTEGITQLTDRVREHLPEPLRERLIPASNTAPPGAQQATLPSGTNQQGPLPPSIAATGPALPRTYDGRTIRIASFNIQVLGISKVGKPRVLEILAQVVRDFDIVAIQELRATGGDVVMDQFMRQINATGAAYQYVIGPRLGRSVSKEQYLFIYDSQSIEVSPPSVVTLVDRDDLLHREPLIGHFRTRPRGNEPPFSFILANIHTDPDETTTELNALGEAFAAVQQNPWGEDDVVLLGDFNVDCNHFGALAQLPNMSCTVHGQPTNTRKSKSYDNIVFNQAATKEFTGTAGILDLQSTFGLSEAEALEVSDHMPVWAEFAVTEAGSMPWTTASSSPPSPASRPSGTTASLPNSPYPSRDAYLRQPR